MVRVGIFEWKRRMGVHEAYHSSTVNRWMHWALIPIELFGVISLLSTLALPVILLVSPLYLIVEPVSGSLMVSFLLYSYKLACSLQLSTLSSGALFFIPFIAQTQIAHRHFEPESRDDTELNLSEFSRTLNPVPLLLVFFYHVVEVVLAAGYRPSLRRTIEYWRDEETKKFGTNLVTE